jgi:cysteine-rich repeat protein
MQSCNRCISRTACMRCLTGRLVTDQTGCSNIVGCVNVNPLASISNNCRRCDHFNFHALPQYGRCVCIEGWIVGMYCTTVVGCTSLMMVGNRSRCIACNVMLHYYLSNGNCLCKTRYYFNGTDCDEVCGDGFVITLPCDDGNLIDGDGCDRNCQIEENYVCANDNSRNPSTNCRVAAKIDLLLVSI